MGRSRSRDGHRGQSRSRSRSPPRRRHGDDRRSPRRYSRSPVRRHRSSVSPPRRRHSRSPPPRRRHSRSPPPSRRRHSRSPPPRRRHSRSPPSRRTAGDPNPPPVGAILRARVMTVRPFGVFVEMEGHARHGLVHFSQVADDCHFSRDDDDELRVKALEHFAPPGSACWIKVLDVVGDKVSCSMRAVDQEHGGDRGLGGEGPPARGGPREGRGGASSEPPPLHAILQGTVRRVAAFGVFVEMDGYSSWGLVHFTQISDYLSFAKDEHEDEKIATLEEIAPVGQRVWVKIVEISQQDPGQRAKVSCSMKLVNQRDGVDLDPGHAKYKARGEGGAGGLSGGGRIGDDAGRTTGGARIDWGHLAADNARVATGGQYAMVDSDEDDAGGRPPRQGGGAQPPHMQQHPGTGVPPAGPRGRGRGSVMPAWMSQGAMVPGGDDAHDGGGGLPEGIESVEQALAIINAYAADKKDKKKKKDKKEKKDKKDKKHKR